LTIRFYGHGEDEHFEVLFMQLARSFARTVDELAAGSIYTKLRVTLQKLQKCRS